MLKKIILALLFPLLSFANTHYYTIKLAVYKDINGLKQEISTLPKTLQQYIQIKHIDNVYKASVKPTEDHTFLKRVLPSYQKVFHDAFISGVNTSTIGNKKERMIVKKTAPFPKSNAVHITSFYDKLKNKTLYLCTYGKTTGWKKILFKTTFTDNHVSYHPLIGKTPPIKAQYKVKNDKLYLFQKNMFNPRVYSRLAYETPQYYAISSWMDYRRINTVRYYFNEKDARRYLHSLK